MIELVTFQLATRADAESLANMNQQLIRDEGHRNPMPLDQLAARMSHWLLGEYTAVLFKSNDDVLGYALFRREMGFLYLRQLFVVPEYRRRGVGRAAIDWLRKTQCAGLSRIRIEVLINNSTGREFWRQVGFRDYCVTMEMECP